MSMGQHRHLNGFLGHLVNCFCDFFEIWNVLGLDAFFEGEWNGGVIDILRCQCKMKKFFVALPTLLIKFFFEKVFDCLDVNENEEIRLMCEK